MSKIESESNRYTLPCVQPGHWGALTQGKSELYCNGFETLPDIGTIAFGRPVVNYRFFPIDRKALKYSTF